MGNRGPLDASECDCDCMDEPLLYALIQNGLDNLDGNIAAAIKTLIERGIGEMEPINPVQAAIAQFITTRMSENPNPVKVELPRAIDGKFSER